LYHRAQSLQGWNFRGSDPSTRCPVSKVEDNGQATERTNAASAGIGMSKPPAFQLYAKDFLGSGTTVMTLAECGAYIRLLCHAWDSDPVATLPDADYALFKLSGADSKDEWSEVKKAVLAKFDKERFPGRLTNLRLREYYDELSEHAEKQTERAKKGAAARWSGKRQEPQIQDEDNA
jgi:uncharacterized protein YdaU (DUF1376 family)